jgi:hypothetical protein
MLGPPCHQHSLINHLSWHWEKNQPKPGQGGHLQSGLLWEEPTISHGMPKMASMGQCVNACASSSTYVLQILLRSIARALEAALHANFNFERNRGAPYSYPTWILTIWVCTWAAKGALRQEIIEGQVIRRTYGKDPRALMLPCKGIGKTPPWWFDSEDGISVYMIEGIPNKLCLPTTLLV